MIDVLNATVNFVQAYNNGFFTILGVVIGTILGLMCSLVVWKLDKNYQERNVAYGFYLEIKESEVRINEMAKVLSNISNCPQRDIIFTRERTPGTTTQTNYMNSRISDVVCAPIESFYPQYGIFLGYRKEISRFHKELAESLYTYYTNLFEAENDRLFLNTAKTSGDSFLNSPEILEAKYKHMKSAIINCSNEIPKLKKLLEDRINKKVLFIFKG
ncbi:MAG: hypothetical protein NTZ24_15435 [Deltaproteobacteria bacterium]|nr:hypothetical protein [Deltaproteobacteria bacterium]